MWVFFAAPPDWTGTHTLDLGSLSLPDVGLPLGILRSIPLLYHSASIGQDIFKYLGGGIDLL